MENYKQEIGLRLKQLRKENSLTQEKLAEMLGISQKHYSEAERGITGLSVKHLIQISDILSVSLDYLLKGYISKYSSEPVKNNVLINNLYFSSSEYTQQQMLKLLQIAKDIETHAQSQKRKTAYIQDKKTGI